MRAVILYASTHGHTAKIASRLAEALRHDGCEADIRDARHEAVDDLTGYDGVVVAASVHGGHHQREVVDWVKGRRAELIERRSLFISVSLTAADDTDEARAAAQKCIDDFIDETAWTPDRSVPVAGALQYREYNAATRTLIRLMMKRGGHPTDSSRDYDYTDWDAIDRIGAEFAAALEQ